MKEQNLSVHQLIYEKNNIPCSQLIFEPESKDYGACSFKLETKVIQFRVAKITPKKVGQFVTFWKRPQKDSPIQPFDTKDPFDFLVVSVKFLHQAGQFVFPKSVLEEKGILAKAGKGGKRALRVYPPWDKTNNQQAQRTQAWQLAYFLEILSDGSIDKNRFTKLYSV